jgi:Fe-S-cluster containining protein
MDSNQARADSAGELFPSLPVVSETDLDTPASGFPAVYFNCSQCGQCCSSWNIPVEGPKARHLLDQAWVQERLASFERTLKPIGSDDLYRIPLTTENVCVFLADDKRCLVEVNEGHDFKPHECHRFPFATVRLPEDTNGQLLAHETSAACKQISDKLLLAFAPILPHPEGSSAEIDTMEAMLHSQCPSTVWLHGFKKAPWSLSEDWRTELKTIFHNDTFTPGEALWMTYQRCMKASNKELQSHQLTRMSRSKLLYPWKERLITLFFLRKPYRTYSAVQLIFGSQYEDRRLFGLPINLPARRHVRWEPIEDRRVKAFLYNLLCRRLPLIRGQSLLSLWAMAVCAWLLMCWYAITLASLRVPANSQEVISVSSEEVSLAIRLTERYYTGHQPTFMHWFINRFQAELLAHWIIH